MTLGGDGARILSTALRGVLAHGMILGPDSPVLHYDAVAEAVEKGLGEFGWSLHHDENSLQAHIDQLVADMPPTCQGVAPRPPERLNG